MNNSKDDIINAFKNCKSAAILPHTGADGDALSSAFAVCEILKQFGKKAVVLSDEPVPDYLSFLSGEIKSEPDTNYDLAIAVDCGDKSRFEKFTGIFDNALLTVNIDHHINTKDYADINYIDDASPATCQIIYDIFDGSITLSKHIAELLLTGIITDSGGFRFSSTSAHTHDVASALMRAGADSTSICENVFENKSVTQALIEAEIISHTKFLCDGKVAMASVDTNTLEKFSATANDIYNISSLLRGLAGVSVSIFAYPKNGEIKISMRTDGTVDASAVCAQFGGGGHKRAAGVTMSGNLNDCIMTIYKAVEKYYAD